MAAPPPPLPSSLEPVRKILSRDDMESFKNSSAYSSLLRLVKMSGESIRQYPPSTSSSTSPLGIQVLCRGLTYIADNWTKMIPPTKEVMRFGNTSFKQWHEEMCNKSEAFLRLVLSCCGNAGVGGDVVADTPLDAVESILDLSSGESKSSTPPASIPILPSSLESSLPELSTYLTSSFGHPVRLDYGTGHESSFMVLLLALLKLGITGDSLEVGAIKNEHKSLLSCYVYTTFQSYLSVTRGIQTVYNLEPAGSHGVWGLDDYHCLPFYFGACELDGMAKRGMEPEVELPNCVCDQSNLDRYGGDYMYIGCIKHVRNLKKMASFGEGSPMLRDVASLPSWSKASKGLERLYEGEVLNRYPVVQHFVFGGVYRGEWQPTTNLRKAPTTTFVGAGGIQPPGGGVEGTKAPWAK